MPNNKKNNSTQEDKKNNLKAHSKKTSNLKKHTKQFKKIISRAKSSAEEVKDFAKDFFEEAYNSMPNRQEIIKESKTLFNALKVAVTKQDVKPIKLLFKKSGLDSALDNAISEIQNAFQDFSKNYTKKIDKGFKKLDKSLDEFSTKDFMNFLNSVKDKLKHNPIVDTVYNTLNKVTWLTVSAKKDKTTFTKKESNKKELKNQKNKNNQSGRY